jgi:hypothetical protein
MRQRVPVFSAEGTASRITCIMPRQVRPLFVRKVGTRCQRIFGPNADNSAYETPGCVALHGLGVPRVGRLPALGQVGRPAPTKSAALPAVGQSVVEPVHLVEDFGRRPGAAAL